ncbi:MAG TPA: pantetheine-phosphate adenylyltransferase [Anaerolineales bacterium]|nr:pantetheine-phosphate adenylyltransferase [Anaerolineales bacterium]
MRRAIFPGSFDPIHYGHIDIVTRGSALFDELVIAVYDRPAKKLLFSLEERLHLVQQTVNHIPNTRVVAYNGLTVDFCEKMDARFILRGLRVFSDFEYEFRMALANQRLSPEIDTISLITREQHTFLSSSTVREVASLNGNVSTMVPAVVQTALQQRYAELANDSN